VNRKRVTTNHRLHLREVRRRFVAALEDGRIDPHERADILDGLDGADAEAAVIDITDGLRGTSPERTAQMLAELAAWMERLPAA
jgi:hypothetical protein